MKNASAPAQTIIQQIQPQCDTLYKKMKHEKDIQGKTNRGMADRTGVPLSTTAKFFSGALTNPGIFGVTALCIDLGLSLDSLMGIAPEKENEGNSRIAALEAQVEQAKLKLEQTQMHNQYLIRGVKERTTVIYALTALCLFLAFAVLIYIIMDMNNLNFGFFRADNFEDSLTIFILVISVFIIAALHFIATKNAKRKMENGKDKSDN